MHWIQVHPILYPTILSVALFVLGVIFSLYPGEIRWFLHHWPQSRILELHAYFLSSNLEMLKKMHGSTYDLTRILLHRCSKGLLVTSTFILAGTLLVFSLFQANVNRAVLGLAIGSVIGMVIGIIQGTSLFILLTMRQLARYERSVRSLENKLAEVTARIAKHRGQMAAHI